MHHVKRFFYDTAGSANPVQMQALKTLVGPSQIVYGTDYPFFSAPATSVGVDTCGFTAQELRAVNRDNALRLMPRLA
jgi:predicted TIM-barrel fold metal-dependent hydrolase